MTRTDSPGAQAVGTATGPVEAPRATRREDLLTVLLGTLLVGGALADGWAHINIVETLEGFFTPWHGLLYAGFTATAAWTFWLAYGRRDTAPRWWRDGWPRGYRLGALGVVLFGVGGLADMVWHETLGVEVGLDAAFSPSHMLLDTGAVLLLTSPLRSWWAGGEGGARAATGVASLALGAMASTILLTHSHAFRTSTPTRPLGPEVYPPLTILGVDAYLVTTVALGVPFLLAFRRRATIGTAAAVVAGPALFCLVMFEFPRLQVWAAAGAVLGAVLADLVLARLDAVRGPDASLRLPLAGAAFAALVWGGHLLGLALADGVRWTPELWTGIITLTAIEGALLGGLAARPAAPGRGPAV
ncbi:hypothetical protein [Micromonospora siamensis]|uniref:Uncharacterized protein n=1 Tax=Micromonospora siamensis TaxID=299152 RepID=A0A1C5IX41_9ACTN|nr:hypothetical protein [Micromonospora siamensis]SCG62947.1 hypothetical protein GA0074704_3904 [Micromonospora siamensis]